MLTTQRPMDNGKSPIRRYKSLQLGTAPAIFITARPRNLIAIALMAVIAGWFRLGGSLTTLPSDVNPAPRPVDQYNITKKNGSLIEICAEARMVSAAYRRANDEANYMKWKATEIADCKAAGTTEK